MYSASRAEYEVLSSFLICGWNLMKAGWWNNMAFPSRRMRRQAELRLNFVD